MKLANNQNSDKLLGTHVFYFGDRGGTGISLTTKIFANGDPDGVYYNQEITLNFYENSASISLYGEQITAEKLRKLANELDKADIEARARIKV